MKKTVITLSILVCILITGGYSVFLYRDAKEQLPEWKASSQETFVQALQIEVKKRGNIPVDVIVVNPAETHTLEEPAPASVILTSKYGKKTYKIPQKKFVNSLVKETRKRNLLSILLEKYPVSVDTLNQNWDSLLLAKKIVANTYIRYSITDLLERTTATYSNKYKQNQQADSLTSYYMGYRCEVEATGFVFYQWWKMLHWWQWTLLFLPWGCLCAFLFAYEQLVSSLRKKFREKVFVIQEKEVIREKVIPVADVKTEKVEIYRLEDGTSFDPIGKFLRNGDNKKKKLAPQTANLLELFFKAENLRLTEKDIYKKMWNGGGDATQLSTLIFRLRKALEDISSIIVFYDGQGTYQLKMPDSIEKNDDSRETDAK